MDKPDFLGLSSQAPQRVVSFPASQSLHASTASPTAAISTGLARLDEALCPSSLDEFSGIDRQEAKGIPGGHVTEVFGPPGVGKTSLALNVASNALKAGGKVVWIDTGSPLPKPRLRDLLASQSSPPPSDFNTNTHSDPQTLTQNLLYIQARTLPHLLSLLHHPPPSFPPPSTALLIIDSISAPFQPYYPAPSDLKARLSTPRTDKPQLSWLLNRKWNVTSDLATQLSRLASTHNMAVLALNQMHTRIKGLPRATLTPVLAGGGWETGVWARVAMYRDFVRGGYSQEGDVYGDGRLRRVRFAEVMKRNGRVVTVRREEETVVPFLIEMDGLRALDEPGSSRLEKAQEQDDVPELESSEPDSPLTPDPYPDEESEHHEEQQEKQDRGLGKELDPELETTRETRQHAQQEPEQTLGEEHAGQNVEQEEQQDVQAVDSIDAATRKRKVEEIADSQDEDSDGEFGWNEDDDAGMLGRH